MFTIFKKTIKEKWLFLLIMSVISVVTVWMYLSLFPTFSKQSDEYEKLLASFPKEVWEIFGIQDGKLSMNTLEKFLSVEMFSLMWPLMAIIIFVNFGSNAIATEIEKGTMEILLSLPVSRLKLFFAKYTAGALMIILFSFVSIMCIIPLAILYKVDYVSAVYLKVFIVGALFSLCGFSLSTLCSAIFEKGTATSLSAGIFLVMYIINILSSLKDSLENLKYTTFFYYLDLSRILSENKIELRSILVFGSITVISAVAAAIYFHKRDVSV